ncbi:O-fucosyltransferase 20 [Stylosanthes scabra]|uniref:O-fucosyltransferase family protein n=1 Tax=Stylosanthes scabra TaxID=79078 RepID=A0ABU6YJ87_9FABA|nr:O-fucosyltransferase 20 [Stylosanthes scabra]
MAKSKNHAKKLSYISVPSQIINSISSSSLQSLIDSPKKSSKNNNRFFSFFCTLYRRPRLMFLTLFLISLISMFKFGFTPFSTYPCPITITTTTPSLQKPHISLQSLHPNSKFGVVLQRHEEHAQAREAIGVGDGDGDDEGGEFWKQPDGLGYKACLSFTRDYRRASEGVMKNRRKYLMVVVSGGMNQQRNQIVDAVVIARILGAALVVPILQVNVIWGDESEFGDIFDFEHFKNVLSDDVRVVSALPSTHLMTRPVEGSPPPHVTPSWIRGRYHRKLTREGVLLLRGLDSRLAKDLPPDLQKLRCKVAFHALRFAKPVQEIGDKIAERMASRGPYLALHLRMEKDVWVRTGCLPGLTREFDEIVNNERIQRPELLTAKSNMTYHERKMAGLCPLNAMEVTRLLKGLGAPRNARIYWAGGEPLGGKEALLPLIKEFPNFYNKEDLAKPGELEPFANKASLMAAIDYIVSEKSDVFMPSHGGNMGHAIQEFNRIMKELHQDSLGQPELRTLKAGRDVTKYPIPECMCKNDSH